MQTTITNDINASILALRILRRDFQEGIATGKKFSEVKDIYLRMKRLTAIIQPHDSITSKEYLLHMRIN